MLAAEKAWACSVCFAEDNDRTRLAYYGITALLSGLPLVLAGFTSIWLYRKSRVRKGGRNGQ